MLVLRRQRIESVEVPKSSGVSCLVNGHHEFRWNLHESTSRGRTVDWGDNLDILVGFHGSMLSRRC